MTKIFLSAGHGGYDPGATGHGLREKDINLNILLACRDELRNNGFQTVCSRITDANDPVQDEVREANASGADLAVSFHTNAGGGDGSETFYYRGDERGLRLAKLCEKHLKAIGQNSRGVKTNDLMFTRETRMLAVLCECAFVDNSTDVKIIDTVREQRAFGVAYARAIMEYFGAVYQGNPKPTPPKPSNGLGHVTVDYALKAAGGTWWPNVRDFNNHDSNGYAGAPFTAHDGVKATVSKGSIKYKAHVKGGGWSREAKDGEMLQPGGIIDGLAFYYTTPEGYAYQQAWYRSQTTDREGYLSPCCDYGASVAGYDGWCGMYGEPLDRLQIAIGDSCPW